MLDLIIKNGLVFDGLGSPPTQCDIGIRDGRIFVIKPHLTIPSAEERDASGLWVTPGFIDIHTHYDLEREIAPGLVESVRHGVTSVVMGNCGVGIAPCKPGTREIAMRDLVNVEGIPFDVLNQGITWDWETFPQFMDAAARTGVKWADVEEAICFVPPAVVGIVEGIMLLVMSSEDFNARYNQRVPESVDIPDAT